MDGGDFSSPSNRYGLLSCFSIFLLNADCDDAHCGEDQQEPPGPQEGVISRLGAVWGNLILKRHLDGYVAVRLLVGVGAVAVVRIEPDTH